MKVSFYLNKKRERALKKAYLVIKSNQTLQRNRLYDMSNEMILYGT